MISRLLSNKSNLLYINATSQHYSAYTWLIRKQIVSALLERINCTTCTFMHARAYSINQHY